MYQIKGQKECNNCKVLCWPTKNNGFCWDCYVNDLEVKLLDKVKTGNYKYLKAGRCICSWVIRLYVYDKNSPTGVHGWGMAVDTENLREKLKAIGATVYGSSSLYGNC